MVLYKYVKAPPKSPRSITGKRFISATFTITGLALIIWVVYPILSFELTSNIKFASYVSPISSNEQYVLTPANASVQNIAYQDDQNRQVLGETTVQDYTKASNWFPATHQNLDTTAGRTYFLSIPKLGIDNAVVKIAGEDLDKTLIQYGGTGIPGEYGTTVIFGHSILPQFYNPSNYKSIFSLLPKLEENDEIFLKYDGITYRYAIYNMRVTTPDDVTVLEQRYDAPHLSLITCVPPGTYWKRLLVQARLEPV